MIKNPDGPYPGRQIFIGMTAENKPCFAYLVTGRSPGSRERKAVKIDNLVRIGPVASTEYDPLRHYAAVEFDNNSKVASISNGIQTEAVYEMYKLILNTSNSPGIDYMEKVLEGAGAEPDSYHTPRIAAVITRDADNSQFVYILGIKNFTQPAKASLVSPQPGNLYGVSTYKGSLENPEGRESNAALTQIELTHSTAEDIANYVFEISEAVHDGNDIRVCTVAGVYSSDKGWELALKNVK
jgi:IMP cyclohydrolase